MKKSKGKNFTVVSVNKPNLDGLSKDESRALILSLLGKVQEILNEKESEEN